MTILIPLLTFGREGGFKVLSKLANAFLRNGHDVNFVVPYLSPLPYHSTQANVIWIDRKGNWTALKPDCMGGNKNVVAKSIYILWLGLKKGSPKKYDIILANQSLTTYPIYFSGIGGKKHYYIQAYEPDFYKELKGFKNWALQWLSKKSYSLPFNKIVNSNLYCNYKEIVTGNVVFPGLDLHTYYPKIKVEIGSRRIRIGTIARRERFKGTHIVIDAYKKILEKRKDVELYLAFGESQMEDKLNNIFVCHPHGDESLAAFYRNLDVYFCALTAQHGAIHYPVIETMASGTALITTDYYPANITNAFMVPPFKSNAFVEAFNLMEKQDQMTLEKIEQGLKDVQQFSWNRVSEKMVAILQTSLF